MRKVNSIKFLSGVCLFLALALLPYGVFCSDAKPVKFKAVTLVPKSKEAARDFMRFADALKKEVKGKVDIKLIGGPEVVPPFQLHEAVRSGQLDMVLTSPSYYVSLSPLVLVNLFSNLPHDELYRIGFFDRNFETHKKLGLVYLGETAFDVQFFIYTNYEVKTPKDLAGKKIRVFPAIAPFIRALGAAPINMGMHEIYSAMERGVVDGFAMSPAGFVKSWSWQEVTKYMIKPGFYRGGLSILANPKSWNRLPEDLQRQIIDWKYNVYDKDPNGGLWFKNYAKDEIKLIEKSGVNIVKFSPEDTRAYLKTAYDSAWDSILKKAPAEGPELKKMLVK